MLDTPVVRVKVGDKDQLWSGFVHASGSGPVDFILGGTESLTVRVTLEKNSSGKSQWSTTPVGSVLNVNIVNPAMMAGVAIPIKIGKFAISPGGAARELFLSAVAVQYGTQSVEASLFFVSFLLGGTAP